jgi:hypothetical protein
MKLENKIILFTGSVGIFGVMGLCIAQFISATLGIDLTMGAMIGAIIATIPISFILVWVVYSPTDFWRRLNG